MSAEQKIFWSVEGSLFVHPQLLGYQQLFHDNFRTWLASEML